MRYTTTDDDGNEWVITDECVRCGGSTGFTDVLDNGSACATCDAEVREPPNRPDDELVQQRAIVRLHEDLLTWLDGYCDDGSEPVIAEHVQWHRSRMAHILNGTEDEAE